MLRRMARCEVVVATRFHAHIAALMTRTPLISFAVAGKTMQLLQDLSLAPGLDRIQLASGGFSGDQVWTAPRQVLSSVRCQELMQQAQFVIQSAAEAVA
jgi:polysaccharide pyruvyl transferase WcaK-like protein